jgi:hypothetical protein
MAMVSIYVSCNHLATAIAARLFLSLVWHAACQNEFAGAAGPAAQSLAWGPGLYDSALDTAESSEPSHHVD